MRKRNKVRNFKPQNDEVEFAYEHSADYLAWIDGFQKDTQKVDALINEYAELLGMGK